MDPTEQIYTCLYQDHVNEPISGFCLSLTCQEKPQCCSQCLMNKHQDHKRDCKTIAQLKLMFQMDVKELPNLIFQTNQKYLKVKKLQQTLYKLFAGERNKMIELEKKMKQPNFFLFNQDFIRLKQLYKIIQQLISNKQETFLTSLIEEMVKMMQALYDFGLLNSDQLKEYIETIQKVIKFKQDEVNLYPDFFNKQIIAYCEQKNCFDQQQCCNLCTNDQKIPIFDVIRPIIQRINQILNYQLQKTEKYLVQASLLYLIMKIFFETKGSFIKEIEKSLIKQDFYQFMQQITQIKQSFQIKQYCLEKIKQDPLISILLNNIADLLESVMNYFQTLIRIDQNIIETVLNKQIKVKINMKKNNFINILKCLNVNQKGNALEKLNHYEDAIKCYDQAIEYNPSFYKAFVNKGFCLVNLNRYEDAIQQYNQAIKLNPNDSGAFFYKGVALGKLNRYEDAIQCYDQAIKLNPNDFKAFRNRGIALVNLNCYEDAIQYYNQAIKLNLNDFKAFRNKGVALGQLNRYVDAIQCFDQAIKLNPKDFKAFRNKGIALSKLKSYEDAIQCCDQAIKLNSKDFDSFLNKGVALSKLNSNEDAIKCFDQAIKLNPKDFKAFRNKGIALGELYRYEDAIQFSNQAIKLNPKDFDSFLNKGVALGQLNRYVDAIQCFDQAIKLNPKDFKAFRNKGIALGQLNHYEDAIQFSDQAIELNPKDFDSFLNKGDALGQLNRYVDAIECYDQAFKLNPNSYSQKAKEQALLYLEMQYLQLSK